MRTKILRATMMVSVFLGAVATAQAQRAGDQGYGIMLGNPSGLSGKIWLDEQFAIDGAAGLDQGEFDAHLSFLVHNFNWLDNVPSLKEAFRGLTDQGQLPFYFGAGARLLFEDEREFGIRLPVGLSYLPTSTPWEFFVELAPVIRLTPDGGLDADYAVGVRYYFAAIRPKGD